MSKPGNIFESSLYDDILLSDEELEAFDEYEKKTLREERVEEGKNQRDKEYVMNMHENGVSVLDIVRYSKLSQEEVEKIINEG